MTLMSEEQVQLNLQKLAKELRVLYEEYKEQAKLTTEARTNWEYANAKVTLELSTEKITADVRKAKAHIACADEYATYRFCEQGLETLKRGISVQVERINVLRTLAASYRVPV